MTNDPYVYPGTRVLINKLNIKSPEKLQQAETEISTKRINQLRENQVKGNFDLEHLKSIHKHIFQDVYSWAGKIRTVDIAKQDKFAPVDRIESYSNFLFKQLHKENHLKGLPADKFSERAAYYLGEINALHAFREGNGRTQREFIRELAANAGHELDFRHITSEEMREASIHSFRVDESKLQEIISKAMASCHNINNTHTSNIESHSSEPQSHTENYGMD
ncbi:Fic family protein [Salmonella enterica]